MYLILVLSLILFAVLLFFSGRTSNSITQIGISALSENLLAKEKDKLRVATHATANALSNIAALHDDALEKEAAMSQAIDNIRYEEDQSGYFFISKGTVIVHVPPKPDLKGKDLKDSVDPNGVKYISELNEKAKQGGGYVNYHFDKPGMGIVPKLAYAEAIPGTEYWLCTGTYLDNIQAQENLLNDKINMETRTDKFLLYSVSSGFFLLVVAPITIAISRSILTPVKTSSDSLDMGAEQIIRASNEINKASNILASGASQQAAAIEETSSSLNEIAGLTDQNQQFVHKANNNMAEANQSISQVHTAIQALAKSMDEISDSSTETQKIIKTIDEIAFQTNLLALNAAVEAARAGEAGAGFAVVAEEVRALAIRSADAARNTANLIESSVQLINQGSSQMSSANNSFGAMMGKTTEVSTILEEIDKVSQQQSDGIKQINKAVEEMNDVVQHNAAQAEECAAASNEMDSQSKIIGEIAVSLHQVVEGSSHVHQSRTNNITPSSFDHGSNGSNHHLNTPKNESRELVFN